jgi:hypothetical protein
MIQQRNSHSVAVAAVVAIVLVSTTVIAGEIPKAVGFVMPEICFPNSNLLAFLGIPVTFPPKTGPLET